MSRRGGTARRSRSSRERAHAQSGGPRRPAAGFGAALAAARLSSQHAGRQRRLLRGGGGGGGGLPARARAQRGRRLLHDGAQHAHADAVAARRHVLGQDGGAAEGRQGPLLSGPRRRAVPLRAGLPAQRRARAARQLPRGPAAAPGGAALPPARARRRRHSTEGRGSGVCGLRQGPRSARLHHGGLPRQLRIRPRRAGRREVPQAVAHPGVRPSRPLPRRLRRDAERVAGPRPRAQRPLHVALLPQALIYRAGFRHAAGARLQAGRLLRLGNGRRIRRRPQAGGGYGGEPLEPLQRVCVCARVERLPSK